ncbi:MAG: hypothetical protein H0X67_20585 [Acidobacteria bacterium]|nr:hypothetical protein [Acidobacteriota bacterium]
MKRTLTKYSAWVEGLGVLRRGPSKMRLALARIRAQYGELQLRLGALLLDQSVMVRVFGWDPDVEGY